MGFFDFLKPKKKRWNRKNFDDPQYQKELTALAMTMFFENNHDYSIVDRKLSAKGFSQRQVKIILDNLKTANKNMVEDFQDKLDSGIISDVKILPTDKHQKGKVGKDQVDRYIGYGAYQMNRGDLQNALELFDKALELDDKATLAYANKGTLYIELGEPEKALYFYNKALELDPEQEHLQTNIGLTLTELGRNEEAISAYEKALNNFPEDVKALNNLGILWAQKGNHTKALKYFENNLKVDPKDSEALINMLTSQATIAPEKAISLFQDAIKEGKLPHDMKSFAIIPSVFYAKGDKQAAEDFLDNQLPDFQSQIEPKLIKAGFYFNREPKRALKIYDEILEENHYHPETLHYKMLLLEKMQDSGELLFTVELNLRINPNNPHALMIKAKELIKTNEIEFAWDVAKQLFATQYLNNQVKDLILHLWMKMDKADALKEIKDFKSNLDKEAHYQLDYCKGLYLKAQKDYDEAIKVFQNLNRVQEFGWNYYQIAIMENNQGKTEESLKHLKKTFELDPTIKQDARTYPELDNLRENKKFIELIN